MTPVVVTVADAGTFLGFLVSYLDVCKTFMEGDGDMNKQNSLIKKMTNRVNEFLVLTKHQ